MSLNAHERHALARIEEELAGADPRFAATLSAFSRMADGEAMPERERIREARRSVMGPAVCGVRPGQPGSYKLVYWAAVAVAVCLTIAVISFALVSGHTGSSGACTEWQTGVCVRQTQPSSPTHSSQKGGSPSLIP